MHIIDRSHNKYPLNLTDNYIIDSSSAKKLFKNKTSESPPLIMLRNKRDRQNLMQVQIKESQSHSRKLTRNNSSSINLSAVKSNLSKTPLKNQKEDYFLPDIKDYHRIVERGVEKLETSMVRKYDEWCKLVKLCFDGGINQNSNSVNVASLELMRLHPVFNRLSFYGVRDFL